jgi:predicted transporter
MRLQRIIALLVIAGAVTATLGVARSFSDLGLLILGVIGFVLLGIGSYMYRKWFMS